MRSSFIAALVGFLLGPERTRYLCSKLQSNNKSLLIVPGFITAKLYSCCWA